MSITGTVENGTIKLPAGVHLPDGTQVRVETVESPGRGPTKSYHFGIVSLDLERINAPTR